MLSLVVRTLVVVQCPYLRNKVGLVSLLRKPSGQWSPFIGLASIENSRTFTTYCLQSWILTSSLSRSTNSTRELLRGKKRHTFWYGVFTFSYLNVSFLISGVLLLQSEEHGGEEDCEEGVPQYGELREQDRFLPIANVARIMKKAIPAQVSRTTITSSTLPTTNCVKASIQMAF